MWQVVKQTCPQCGGPATISIQEDRFPYGEDPDPVWLTAEVYVHSCDRCDFHWTDGNADLARDDAIKRYNEKPE